MTENQYQAKVIRKLKKLFPGCVIVKTDSGYQQGSTDLILLFRQFWAALEVKASATSREQPNQRYFVKKLNGMSFAAFIYPENEAEVMSALQQAFEVSG
jgi:Holliday junction resolvase-like predicted endonuclease